MLNPDDYDQDFVALTKLKEYKDIFITLELCLFSAKTMQLSPVLIENKLRNCTKKLKKRTKSEENREILRIFDKKKVLSPSLENWLKNRDNYHNEFDFYIHELEAKLSRYQK